MKPQSAHTSIINQKKQTRVFVVVLLLAMALLVLDLALPIGYASSLGYIILSFVLLWSRDRQQILAFASLATLLIVLGYFGSGSRVPYEIDIFNRSLSLFGIWSASYILYLFSRSEEARNRDMEQLAALYKAATEAIVVSNDKGEIVLANPRSYALFGYKENELIGRKIETLMPERVRHAHVHMRQGYYEDPMPRAMGRGRDLYAQRKDGSEFPVEISLSFFRNDGFYVISLIIDITMRKEAEAALRQAKAEAEHLAEALKQSNRELEMFAYIASHDLQEPLRKVQAFGDRLKSKEKDNISPESIDYLDRILNASHRMKGLINDLLGFSRVATQAKPFEKVDLNILLHEILSDLEIAMEASKAEVQVGPLPVLEADPLQMRQLFQNLLSNALKFRKEGVQPIIRVHGKEVGPSTAKIYVEDNGIGFAQKYAEKIFTIFQRLEGRSYEGTGMGLAICRKIAMRHGGSISACSKPGQGTTFEIELPLNHFSTPKTNNQ